MQFGSSRARVYILAAGVFAGAASVSFAQLCENIQNRVNLEWRPDLQTALVGDTVDFGIYAVSANQSTSESMAALQIILQWDPEVLQLLGNINNGPYEWLDTIYPNDVNLDGLNAPFLGVPGNDGDAFLMLFSQLAPPPFGPGSARATPEGLLVTTFRFRVLAPAVMTEITIPAALGEHSSTIVASGIVAGCDIKGTLDSANLRSTLETVFPGDGDGDSDVDLLDFGRLQDCATGHPDESVTNDCVAFDFDFDIDVDLDDFSAFQDARTAE